MRVLIGVGATSKCRFFLASEWIRGNFHWSLETSITPARIQSQLKAGIEEVCDMHVLVLCESSAAFVCGFCLDSDLGTCGAAGPVRVGGGFRLPAPPKAPPKAKAPRKPKGKATPPATVQARHTLDFLEFRGVS